MESNIWLNDPERGSSPPQVMYDEKYIDKSKKIGITPNQERTIMKKELISAVIGAGIVGVIWAYSAHLKCGQEKTVQEGALSQSESVVDKQHPGKMKKRLEGIYSTLPDKEFPGLKLYSTDFLIPLNRLYITRHIYVDDPDGFYGSGGRPMCACVFGVQEKGDTHYFLAGADQDGEAGPFVYLGLNIDIEKVEPAGNGYWLVTYKDKQGRVGRGYVPIQGIVGADPVSDMGIAQPLSMNPLAKYAEDCDHFVWEMNARQLWDTYLKAIREDDRMTVAKMHRFPIERNGINIYTRTEFLEQYDNIYTPSERDSLLNDYDPEDIMYSWRGARLPNGIWLINAYDKNAPAGPLED